MLRFPAPPRRGRPQPTPRGRPRLRRVEPIKTARVVTPTLAKAFPNDEDRCVAYTMAEWPRVKYAIAYNVSFRPVNANSPSSPVSDFVTDDAWYDTE